MRTTLLIGLAAATMLTSPAVARDRHHHHRGHEVHRVHHRVAYVAPYRNWAYHRVRTGYQLRRAFYGPRYVVTDYGYYRLRAPARYQRWVRYGDDLLLVNIRTGRVLEVLPGRYY